MDSRCEKVLADPCNYTSNTVDNCRHRERLQEYWDEVFRNRDIHERVQDANEYAEGRVDDLGAGVDLWRRANVPIPLTDIKVPVPTSPGDLIRIIFFE